MTNRRTYPLILGSLLSASAFVGCDRAPETEPRAFDIVRQFPHDAAAYTQGLAWDDTVLYESTGLYGQSQLRVVDLASGTILRSVALPHERFGEGLALLGDRLYQLTWQSGVAYVYDKATLSLVDSIPYAGEGWGLATDGRSLIMSDGSDSLRVVEPATFTTERVVHVRYQGVPLRRLNELEYVDGDVLANVYESDWVVRIDLTNGEVTQVIDLADLYPKRPGSAEVMNGIAIAPNGRDLLVGGKRWPTLFQVRLKDSSVTRVRATAP